MAFPAIDKALQVLRSRLNISSDDCDISNDILSTKNDFPENFEMEDRAKDNLIEDVNIDRVIKENRSGNSHDKQDKLRSKKLSSIDLDDPTPKSAIPVSILSLRVLMNESTFLERKMNMIAQMDDNKFVECHQQVRQSDKSHHLLKKILWKWASYSSSKKDTRVSLLDRSIRLFDRTTACRNYYLVGKYEFAKDIFERKLKLRVFNSFLQEYQNTKRKCTDSNSC